MLLVLNGAVFTHDRLCTCTSMGRYQIKVTRMKNCGCWRLNSYKICKQFKGPRLLYTCAQLLVVFITFYNLCLM